jgi:hypothetical protein
MSFATGGDLWHGPVTVDFYNTDPTPDVSLFTITGLLASVPSLSFEKKTSTITLADGSEVTNSQGWSGTLELAWESFDQTTITTLEGMAPGQTTDVEEIRFTFTDLGSGTNTYATLKQISGLDLSIETGDAWKLKATITVTGSASDDLSSLIVFTQPS